MKNGKGGIGGPEIDRRGALECTIWAGIPDNRRGPAARRGCEKPERVSAADLIWKEKLDMSVTPIEAIMSLLVTGVFVGLMLALGS
jgi:hypothetical protein